MTKKKILKNEDITWVIHCVSDDTKDMVFHTHGLTDFIGAEIDLVIPIDIELAKELINGTAIKMINEELIIYDGIKLHDIIDRFPLMISLRHDIFENKSTWRIVIPDANGRFPDDDGCDEIFKKQFENIKR